MAMETARKVEALISSCVGRISFRRWERCSRAKLAAQTSHRVCGKNSWKEETKIQIHAAIDRSCMSICMDFGCWFSWKTQFQDCQPGSCDPESGSPHFSHTRVRKFAHSQSIQALAHSIRGRLPQGVYFASLATQSEFDYIVSSIYIKTLLFMS